MHLSILEHDRLGAHLLVPALLDPLVELPADLLVVLSLQLKNRRLQCPCLLLLALNQAVQVLPVLDTFLLLVLFLLVFGNFVDPGEDTHDRFIFSQQFQLFAIVLEDLLKGAMAR